MTSATDSDHDRRDFVTASEENVACPTEDTNLDTSEHSDGDIVSRDGTTFIESPPEEDHSVSENQYLGQQFFRHALEESPDAASDEQSRTQPDSAMGGFPYQDALNKLLALQPVPELVQEGASLEQTLMINIGASVRQGDEQFKQDLADGLRECQRRNSAKTKHQEPEQRASGESHPQPEFPDDRQKDGYQRTSHPQPEFPHDGQKHRHQRPSHDLEVVRQTQQQQAPALNSQPDLNLAGHSQPTGPEAIYESRQADQGNRIAEVNATGNKVVNLGPQYVCNINMFVDARPRVVNETRPEVEEVDS